MRCYSTLVCAVVLKLNVLFFFKFKLAICRKKSAFYEDVKMSKQVPVLILAGCDTYSFSLLLQNAWFN